MPLAAIAGIGAVGSIGSALIGSHSASSAAAAQQQAAQEAAQLQALQSGNALNYQNGIYGQTEQNLNPYLGTGLAANSQLGYLLGLSPQSAPGGMVAPAQTVNPSTIGYGKTPANNAATAVPSMGSMTPSLNAPQAGASGLTPSGSPSLPINRPQTGAVAGIGGINQGTPILTSGAAPSTGAPGGGFGSLTQRYGAFEAPTGLTMENDPGYQARLQLGTDAIQRSAAARGNVLTGGTAKALDQFGQDYASNEYNNVYNRALQSYGTNYGVWNNDNNNIYSRLMGLSGSGQSAANSLGAFGQESANNVSNNLLGTGAQIGQDFNNAGAANASGIVGSGNAWQSGLTGATNGISQLLMLKQLGMM